MFKIISAIFILSVFGAAQGQLNQTCSHVQLVTPNHFFEVEKALGQWYAIELFAALADDAKPLVAKCVKSSFSQTPEDMELIESYVDSDTGETVVASYPVSVNSETPAIWSIDGPAGTSNQVWLQTDYENWAVLFACNVENNYRYERFLTLSRQPTIDPRTLEILRVLATGYGFPRANGRLVDQDSC